MDVYIEKQLSKKQRKSEQQAESQGSDDGPTPALAAIKPTKLD